MSEMTKNSLRETGAVWTGEVPYGIMWINHGETGVAFRSMYLKRKHTTAINVYMSELASANIKECSSDHR